MATTGNGNPAAPCDPKSAPTGYTTEYEEGLDIDQTKVNGGAPGATLTDGGVASLDSTKMDRDPARGCAPRRRFFHAGSFFGALRSGGGTLVISKFDIKIRTGSRRDDVADMGRSVLRPYKCVRVRYLVIITLTLARKS